MIALSISVSAPICQARKPPLPIRQGGFLVFIHTLCVKRLRIANVGGLKAIRLVLLS